MKKISVSFLKQKVSIEDTLISISNTDADFIHVDVMDGKFVPNTFLKLDEIKHYLSNLDKPLDVHLMVEKPIDYIEIFKDLNTKYITIHIEIKEDIYNIINLIKSYNISVGLAISPNTSINELVPYLNIIDYINVLGVTPGAGGQKLMLSTLDTVNKLKYLRDLNKGYNYLIAFDGGVNLETISLLNYVDIIISGSYITLSDDLQEKINSLRI